MNTFFVYFLFWTKISNYMNLGAVQNNGIYAKKEMNTLSTVNAFQKCFSAIIAGELY